MYYDGSSNAPVFCSGAMTNKYGWFYYKRFRKSTLSSKLVSSLGTMQPVVAVRTSDTLPARRCESANLRRTENCWKTSFIDRKCVVENSLRLGRANRSERNPSRWDGGFVVKDFEGSSRKLVHQYRRKHVLGGNGCPRCTEKGPPKYA